MAMWRSRARGSGSELAPLLDRGEVAGPQSDSDDDNPVPYSPFDRLRGFSAMSVAHSELRRDDAVDAVLQAAVFVDDAVHSRSVRHRTDRRSLELYRLYYSQVMQWAIFGAICVLLGLSFFEYPSAMHAPRAALGTIEGVCLAVLFVDIAMRWRVLGRGAFVSTKWNVCFVVMLAATVVDFIVSLALPEDRYFVVRRILRPFFLAQSSALMKKALKNVLRCVPEVASVLCLLALHLFVFACLGCMLFRGTPEGEAYFGGLRQGLVTMLVLLTTANHPDVMMPAYSDNRWYALFFVVFLLVGLYCVMNVLTAIIYNQFRGYLTESIQASYLRRKVAMRAAFEVLRRHAHAGGAVGDAIPAAVIRRFVGALDIPAPWRFELMATVGASGPQLDLAQFLELITPVVQRRGVSSRRNTGTAPEISRVRLTLRRVILNVWYGRASNLVVLAGALAAAAEITDEGGEVVRSWQHVLNGVFTFVYTGEALLRIYVLGPRALVRGVWTTLDTVLVATCFGAELGILAGRGVSPHSSWDLARTLCLALVLRIVRIVPTTPRFHAMAVTIGHLLRALSTFAWLLVIMYYEFACVGITAFAGRVRPDNPALNGTDFAKLDYWPNTFDTFASSAVVLWDLMVVNNWYIIMEAHVAATSEWARLFFIAWYLVSVVVATNLIVALVLEAFILRWESLRNEKTQPRLEPKRNSSRPLSVANVSAPIDVPQVAQDAPVPDQGAPIAESAATVLEDIFGVHLREPSEGEILAELNLGVGVVGDEGGVAVAETADGTVIVDATAAL